MAIFKVARMGHPVLRQRARELNPDEIGSPGLAQLIGDMVETMHEYGGIGLAAPQVHHSLRLAIIEFDRDSNRYPDMGEQSQLVLINPVWKPLTDETQSFWEGCLSVPGLRGFVTRPKKIEVAYTDPSGQRITIEAEGFLATVFQHELDHLDGVLYIDRIQNLPGQTKLVYQEEFEKYQPTSPDDMVD